MLPLSIVAILGAVQGCLVLVFIILRQRHPKNMPLALLLLVFSVRLATIPTWNAATLLAHPWVYPLTAPLPFLFGFLLWWYARELANESTAGPPRIMLHALPWAAETLAVVITLLIMSRPEYESFVYNVFAGNPPAWMPVRNALKVVANLTYVAITLRIAFGKKSARLSPAKRIWLRSLAVVPAVVLVFFAYVAIFPGASARLAEGSGAAFLILAMTMTVLIYAVSLLILIAPEVSGLRKTAGSRPNDPMCTDEECERIAALVADRFSRGEFRNPDLSLSDLAARLKLHPNRLSYAVNHAHRCSFRCYLNRARLEYFTRSLKDDNSGKRSILWLAFDAGFPSKSTFNRVFKEHYGIPPSEFAKGT